MSLTHLKSTFIANSMHQNSNLTCTIGQSSLKLKKYGDVNKLYVVDVMTLHFKLENSNSTVQQKYASHEQTYHEKVAIVRKPKIREMNVVETEIRTVIFIRDWIDLVAPTSFHFFISISVPFQRYSEKFTLCESQ
jgi:hypothetical protein